eukprot:473026-Alexandrium_andersonii.AAC.1
MGQYIVDAYGAQMRDQGAPLREDASPDEVARGKLPSLEAFPYPDNYEPIAFGEPAQGQGV